MAFYFRRFVVLEQKVIGNHLRKYERRSQEKNKHFLSVSHKVSVLENDAMRFFFVLN